jgi:hypothetical protein
VGGVRIWRWELWGLGGDEVGFVCNGCRGICWYEVVTGDVELIEAADKRMSGCCSLGDLNLMKLSSRGGQSQRHTGGLGDYVGCGHGRVKAFAVSSHDWSRVLALHDQRTSPDSKICRRMCRWSLLPVSRRTRGGEVADHTGRVKVIRAARRTPWGGVLFVDRVYTVSTSAQQAPLSLSNWRF